MTMTPDEVTHPFATVADSGITLAVSPNTISCGFPSPAQYDTQKSIDLFAKLIRHPSTTFVCPVEGDSMKGAGISHGDIALIDRSLEPRDGRIAMAWLDGGFTLKRLKVEADTKTVWLMPENDRFQPVKVTPDNEHFLVWGILIHVIKSFPL